MNYAVPAVPVYAGIQYFKSSMLHLPEMPASLWQYLISGEKDYRQIPLLLKLTPADSGIIPKQKKYAVTGILIKVGSVINGVDIILSGENQPEENSIGTYIPVKDKVAFLNGPNVSLYDVKDGSISESVVIHWGHTKADGAEEDEFMELPEEYNHTSLIYTGTKGAELGFLNVDANVIELYDISSGFLTKKLELPLMTVSEESFNFAYANGIFWLFNITDRKWEGYK